MKTENPILMKRPQDSSVPCNRRQYGKPEVVQLNLVDIIQEGGSRSTDSITGGRSQT